MKKKAMKSLFATALSIFAVTASCMASDASEAARAEIRGRVVKVADGDTIEIIKNKLGSDITEDVNAYVDENFGHSLESQQGVKNED